MMETYDDFSTQLCAKNLYKYNIELGSFIINNKLCIIKNLLYN